MRRKNDGLSRVLVGIAIVVILVLFAAYATSASAAGGGDGSTSVQDLLNEIAELQAQLASLQQSNTGGGITMPSQGGSISYPNKLSIGWNSNNTSWGGVDSGWASININTIYQLTYGNWSFTAPDESGHWSAQYAFGGTEIPTNSYLNADISSSGNSRLQGLNVNEDSYAYSYSSAGQNWTTLSASLNVNPGSLILSSWADINDYPDWANSSVKDFNGSYFVNGELYSGVPVNPQEPMQIQGLQSQILRLQSQLGNAGSSQNVPEPGTLALLVAFGGVAGVVVWRKKR